MDPQENICTTCLCKDRSLIPMSKISSIIEAVNLEVNRPGFLCWECSAIIIKFHKFKICTELAATALYTQKKKLIPLSTLGRATKSVYDYNINYNDPLTEYNLDEKTELDVVKNEPDDTDFKDENSIYVENFQTGIEKVEINVGRHKDSNITKTKRKSRKIASNIDKKEITKDALAKSNGLSVANITNPKTNFSDIEEEEKDEVEVDTSEDSDADKSYVKREQRKVKKTENAKLDDKSHSEVQKKFSVVVFTEEEIIKSREEKRNHHNYKKIPFKCDSCVLGFTKELLYLQHVKKKHSESVGNYLCPVCSTRFSTDRAMERHKKKHYTCYRCKLCKYNTLELWSALNHCRSKHSRDTTDNIHCAQCLQVYRTPEDLADHVRKDHSIYCKECGVKFKGRSSLRSHRRRIHAVFRGFQCDLCKKTFTKKSRLESHMVTHNGTIAKKLAYCAICNVQYKNLYIYRSHLRNSTNHSERSYPCPECNKKFSSKSYRTQHHNFYHLQKSSYKCDTCNKLFISDWRLRNHKQIKHGMNRPRDHPCTVCGKKFFTVSTLRAHQLIHSEHRTYMCEDCGDTFRQRSALYTHARLVHKSVKS